MNEQEWLVQLKAGDKVYISQSYSKPPTPGIVHHITRTQIVVNAGTREKRFRRETGWEKTTDIWHREHLIMPSPEIDERITLWVLKQQAIRLRDKLAIPQDIKTLEKFIATLSEFVQDAHD